MNTPITETPLFKSVAPRVARLISPDELELEFLRAARDPQIKIKWNEINVDRALTWATMPQGHEFWSKIDQEYNRN